MKYFVKEVKEGILPGTADDAAPGRRKKCEKNYRKF